MTETFKRILPVVLLFLLAGCQTQPPVETTTVPTVQTTAATEETTAPTEYIGLTLDADPAEAVTTVESSFLITGCSDPAAAVTVNGIAVPQSETGEFSWECPLQVGENTVTVVHKEEEAVFSVKRDYCIQYVTPSAPRSYGSGATVRLQIAVRRGSTVTATFLGKSIEMTEAVDQLGMGLHADFVLYNGSYTLREEDAGLELGAVEFTVTCDGITETRTTGALTCNTPVEIRWSDPEATPEGYRNVGSGYILEIIDTTVETFNGLTTDDYSHPTYNYLPAGTVDYASASIIINDADLRTRLLRCGIRVYERGKNTPYQYLTYLVDCYNGSLPDHNEVNISSLSVQGHHTYLTLDVLWKAPFFFDFEAQDYEDARFRKYTVEEFTASYVDITFCYATRISGTPAIEEDHPLFSGFEWIENTSDHTLRLYLKEPGGLYGWDACYNDAGQLVFRFLNPVTVEKADNAYGVDLTGVTVMLDVGHGGIDVGASGRTAAGAVYSEAERNVYLSQLIRQELESIGATVIMNRETNEDTITQRERIRYLIEQGPDYCLAVHHNSASGDSLHEGYETYYFTTFSHDAATGIHEATRSAELYRSHYLGWHFYYVARQTACPIVLVECGYMSSPYDMERIADNTLMQQKAEAIVRGIAEYFLDRTEKLEQ